MEEIKVFLKVLKAIGEKCWQVQADRECEHCPFYVDYDKCIKWEENIYDLNESDVEKFMEFEPPYFIDGMYDEDFGTERGEI